MKIPLIPINDCVLVEWEKSPYEGIPVPEGKYASRTEGKVIATADDEEVGFMGKTVYWEEYKDTVRTEYENKTYAFIKIEDIRGFRETD